MVTIPRKNAVALHNQNGSYNFQYCQITCIINLICNIG
nr:MAG TPA_asm: hypothetical protein [Caudoviricetes sp.]